jgi:16S rRNA (cytosine967-C5)-methyltransferase
VIAPARRAAYRILHDVERGNRDLSHALAHERERLGDARDQALAAAIVLGALRWQAALDYLVTHFARRRPDTLDPEVLVLLRLGAYQLLHLARVPPSAVVNDAVNLAREARKSSASGLVNAVLRAIDRNRASLPLPARPSSPPGEESRDSWLDYFAITLSHPRWLVERWLKRYGVEATEQWLRFNNTESPLTLRTNTLQVDRNTLADRLKTAGVATVATRFSPDGLVVTSGNPLQGGAGTARGATTAQPSTPALFLVQDEASQLVPQMLPLAAGQRVLDACAAPGGKTVALAGIMGDRGVIVACDLRPARVALLADTLARSGLHSARIVRADFTRPVPFHAAFDVVLLDAPCSGLGTLRRDPDVKWRRREADLQPLAAIEVRMLQHASEAVTPGGHLLYATCSSEPEENEEVVESFLAGRPAFGRVAAPPLAQAPHDPSLVDDKGQLRTLPHVHGLEAFFAALLIRKPTND